MMKYVQFSTVIAVIIAVLLLSGACDIPSSSSTYRSPAEVFDVKFSETGEPKIDGVTYTYDSQARIKTVNYTIDRYEYTQEYTYDAEKIVIKTIYKTEIIEEKIIKYDVLPAKSGFTTVDGYFVRVIDDMIESETINEADSSNYENNSGNEDEGVDNDNSSSSSKLPPSQKNELINMISQSGANGYYISRILGSDDNQLILSYGTAEAERSYDVYSINDNGIQYQGSLSGGHAFAYIDDATGAFSLYYGNMGYYHYGPVTYIGGLRVDSFEERSIQPGEEYPDCPGTAIEFYQINDYEALDLY